MKKIIILILISILIGLIIIKISDYMSYTQTHIVEKAKIINKYEYHGKFSEYKITVDTLEKNNEFEFEVQKSQYDSLNKNDIIKIEYDFNDFKYLTDTISHAYIINKEE